MYAVVGCSNCEALWVVEGRPETTGCPRCGKRHQFPKLKKFVETDDRDHAKDARAALLAKRQGHGQAFDSLDSFGDMEELLDDVGPSDEEYLAGSGLDVDEVADAGARATQSRKSRSKRDVVLEALDELDDPDEAAVVAFAEENGVSGSYVRSALEKLQRAGEVTDVGGTYRRL